MCINRLHALHTRPQFQIRANFVDKISHEFLQTPDIDRTKIITLIDRRITDIKYMIYKHRTKNRHEIYTIQSTILSQRNETMFII